MNRTITERARAMRLHAGLPLFCWTDAVHTAIFLINRSPSKRLNKGNPEEAWTGKPVNYSYLRVFGCEAFMHIDSASRGKLDPKSRKCYFLGYGGDEYGYRVWDGKNVYRSRNVVFNESKFYKDRDVSTGVDKFDYIEFDLRDTPGAKENVQGDRTLPEPVLEDEPTVATPPPQLRQNTSDRPAPDRYSPTMNHILYTDAGEHETLGEALEMDTWIKWEKTM